MRLGFIGAGNMAQAIIGGVLASGLLKKEDIIASAATEATIERVRERFGIRVTLDNRETAQADIIVLAVKPIYCAQVMEEISGDIRPEQILISIAAGKSIEWLENGFGKDKKIVRTMPNTPALVGEGMTAVCPNGNITEEDLQTVCVKMEY